MGKPAARMGDMTSHGGALMAGAPTVLIGGMMAARMNDMHTCPLVNPGVPPPPHVGGPALLGSPTVLICGQMALRMGDMAQCSGPPDSIVGGCPTVLIGEGASAGAAGFGPAGAAASAAMAGAESAGGEGTKTTAEEKEEEEEEKHFLHVSFVDDAGNPITGVNYRLKTPSGDETEGSLSGDIKKSDVKQGNYEIQLKGIMGAWWSISTAKVGDQVKLTANTFGIESGAKTIIRIYLKDSNSMDKLIKVIETTVDDDKIEAEWTLEVDDDLLNIQDSHRQRHGYSSPEYFFTVLVDSCTARSESLRFEDWIELELKDKDNNPVGDIGYKAFLANGEIREGKLDSNGYAKEEKIPPGRVEVTYDDAEEER